MSLIIAYHDRGKAIMASDDRVTLYSSTGEKRASVCERACKIILLPRNLVFGSVGRFDIGQKLFAGTMRMCQEQGLDFDQLSEVLPSILRMAWNARTPLPAELGIGVNRQDCILAGFGSNGKIKCNVFLSDRNFEPVETTAARENRVAVIGAFESLDENLLGDFTQDIGLRGERQRAPWIAAKIRDLINEISGLHPESIGRASYYVAISRDGRIELPSEFPMPPDVPSPERELAGAHATAGRCFIGRLVTAGQFFLGSIRTPAQGAADTFGQGDGGVGVQGGMLFGYPMAITPAINFANSASGTGASLTGINNALDDDPATYAELTVTGNGISQAVIFSVGSPPGASDMKGSTASLRVLYSIAQNNLAGASGLNVSGMQAGTVHFTDGGGATLTPFSGSIFTVNGAGPVPVTEKVWDVPAGTNLATVMFYIDASSFVSLTSGALKIRIHSIKMYVQS